MGTRRRGDAGISQGMVFYNLAIAGGDGNENSRVLLPLLPLLPPLPLLKSTLL